MEELIAAIRERLKAGTTVEAVEATQLLRSLAELRAVDETAEVRLLELGKQGNILHHLQNLIGSDDAAAWCTFVYLRAEPAGRAPPEVGLAQAGHNKLTRIVGDPANHPGVVKEFIQILREVDEMDLLVTVFESYPSARPLVLACLQELRGEETEALFRPEVFLDLWQLLEEGLDETAFASLVSQLVKGTQLLKAVQEKEFSAEDASLYWSLLDANAASRVGFRNWCVKGLRSLSQEAWVSELEEDGYVVGLLFNLLRRKVEVSLQLPFRDALEDHAGTLARGQGSVSEYEEEWSLLLEAMDDGAQRILGVKLLDLVLGLRGAVNGAFFTSYGSLISPRELLRQRRDVPLYLFTPLLTTRNELGLAWLSKLLESERKLLDDFDPAVGREFRDRAREAMPPTDESADAAGQHILAIAKTLRIRRSPKSTD